MALVIRPLEQRDFQNGFLEILASLAEVRLTPEEAQRIHQARVLAGVVTVVAEAEGRVVGTGTLLIERKFIHGGGVVGHIEDVAVGSDQHGKGVGSELVRHLTDLARQAGCYKVILNCRDAVMPFYIKLGYRRHDNGMRYDCVEKG